jgi:beta-mannosidase
MLKIGFRTIQLNESLIDSANPSMGRNFFFLVNDVPIFLKGLRYSNKCFTYFLGTNWIPADVFSTRVDANRLRFLVASMQSANMNAVRVWGGGRYESNLLYELADEAGLLVWQDAMFACAYYPVDQAFLTSVRKEIVQQVSIKRTTDKT